MRYFRLYLHFLRFSLARDMQFRFDFTFKIVMDCIFYLVNILFYKVLFYHSAGLAGWTEQQTMIFISGFFVLDAIQMTVVMNGTWMIPTLINKGELDYYLLRPVSSLFFLATRDFAFNSFINLIIATGIMVWAFMSYPEVIPLWKIILYGFLIINGTYLFFLLRILVICPVFWTHSGRGLEVIFWTLDKFAERPDAIYTGWMRKILISVMPFAIMCSLPARVLFQNDSLEIAAYCFGIVMLFHFITIKVWNFGLRNYSSASS